MTQALHATCADSVGCTKGFAPCNLLYQKPASLIRCGGYTSRRERDVAQAVEYPPVKVSIILSIVLSGSIWSLGYFALPPVVHNWSIKISGMCCFVCWKMHIKDPFLLIGKICFGSFSALSLKKYVTMIICLTSNSR